MKHQKSGTRGPRRSNVFYRLFFNRGDERCYGRFAFFFDTLMMNFSGVFAGGAFYTAFLRLNDISMADVGVMTYMPIIANLSCLFTPLIFRKMKRRKAVLMLARISYYLFNLVGVALVPFLVQSAGMRIFLMSFFLSFANVIWGLFAGGFADWELNVLPQDGTREDFFAYRSLICSIMTAITQFLAGLAATALEATAPETQLTWLFWLRLGGFLFILLDVVVFLRAKEYPYPQSETNLKFKDVLLVPMHHKAFRNAMLWHSGISFGGSLITSSWTYYLLDCGVKYSTLSFLSAIPPVCTLLLTPLSLRIFKKMGCVNSSFLFRVIEATLFFGYIFIVPATAYWLYPLLHVLIQISSVGLGIADMNFIYLFMPKKDRVTYYSFYYVTNTIFSFLGAFVGAQYIIYTEGKTFQLFGITLANVQLLRLLYAICFMALAILFAFMRKSFARQEKELILQEQT